MLQADPPPGRLPTPSSQPIWTRTGASSILNPAVSIGTKDSAARPPTPLRPAGVGAKLSPAQCVPHPRHSHTEPPHSYACIHTGVCAQVSRRWYTVYTGQPVCMHTHTHTRSRARSTQQARNQPAQPSVRCPPPERPLWEEQAGRHGLAGAESAPGRWQGHRQVQGKGVGQLVRLAGDRSWQPQLSSPRGVRAQSTHHQACVSILGECTASLADVNSCAWTPRCRRSPSPFRTAPPSTPTPWAPNLCFSPGHHLIIHLHYAVGVTASRPAKGGGS